jgi:hypothetical protein
MWTKTMPLFNIKNAKTTKKLSDHLNIRPKEILKCGEAVLADNGEGWTHGQRYVVVGKGIALFHTHDDLREAVRDWADAAALEQPS